MGIPANRQLSSGPIGAIHCGRALPPPTDCADRTRYDRQSNQGYIYETFM